MDTNSKFVEMVFRRVREDGEDGVISYGYKFKVIK